MTLRAGVDHHTFTVVARCPDTGLLGVGVATYSLAVGGYCPFIRPRLGAMAIQAHSDPRLGPLALRLLALGYPPAKVLMELQSADPFWNYRQVGIVDRNGTVAVHTGEKARPWAGHFVGDGVIAMGNVLSGPPIVESMLAAYRRHDGNDFADRLLQCLEAGRDAGGQANGLPARSASLHVYEAEEHPMIDLRVDLHQEAIAELRRCYRHYKPLIPYYYELRSRDPAHAPSHVEWERQHPPTLPG
jgi:uncharacterized Ntn-hydrolase superfamily protein